MAAQDITGDMILELSSITGTGNYLLDGPPAGYRSFVSGLGNNNTVLYFARNATFSKWELCYGVITDAAPDTLTRVLVQSSTGALINWQAADAPIRIYTAPLNFLINNILRCHYGVTRPAWMKQGLWIDSAAAPTGTLLKFYTGTADVTIGTLNETTNQWTVANRYISPITTRGDIFVGVAGGADGRFPIDAVANKILITNGTDPAWQTLQALLDTIVGNTRGALMLRGAAGWTMLTPGTAGLFLQSAGPGADPLYAAVDPPKFELVGKSTLTGATEAIIAIPSSFEEVDVDFNLIGTSGGATINFRWYGAGVELTSNYGGNALRADSTNVTRVSFGSGAAAIGPSIDGGPPVVGTIRIPALQSANRKAVTISSTYTDNTNKDRVSLVGGADNTSTAVISGIRIYTSSGTISGVVSVSGRKT